MAIKVTLQREAHAIVLKMAKEAGIGVADMCEIAVYNLVALWMREHADSVALDDAHDLDGSN